MATYSKLTSVASVDRTLIKVKVRERSNLEHVVTRVFHHSLVPVLHEMLDQIEALFRRQKVGGVIAL